MSQNEERHEGREGFARRHSGGARFWAWVVLAGLLGLAMGRLSAATEPVFAASGWLGRAVHGHGFGRFGSADPELRKERAEFAAEWILRKVDATPEQQARVKQIVRGAVDDLSAFAEQHHENREAIRAALTGEVVDRQGLEAVRASGIQSADRASVRLVRAVADAAEALTPEQRRKLAEMAERLHH